MSNEPPKDVVLFYEPAFFCRYEYTEIQGPILDPNIKPEIYLWIRHPAELNYHPNGAFPLNLANTPRAVAKGKASSIDVDDHTNDGGYTTAGPLFPHAYSSGGVYISHDMQTAAFNADERACKNMCPVPSRGKTAHDETLIVHWVPDEDMSTGYSPKRYHGFFGKQFDEKCYPQLWLVWHSGTLCSEFPHFEPGDHSRAPKKLWIPDASLFKRPVRPPECKPAEQGAPAKQDPPPGPIDLKQPENLYLEQYYATFTAALDIPKQPSASGDKSTFAGMLAANEVVAAPGFEPKRPNLNVISAYAPGEVCYIKQRLNGNCLEVQEGETLVDALSSYIEGRTQGPGHHDLLQFDNLDIIGHSRSGDRILKLGEFALTSRVAREQFRTLYQRGILAALGIKAIRLLGCRTAAHRRGQRVVRIIEDETALDLYATRSDLFAVHFDGKGLRSDARSLLANYSVIAQFGPGDIPPRDDYPIPAPDDDDDDEDTSTDIKPDVPAPAYFSLAALSDINAASVSAHNYLFWNPPRFGALSNLLYTTWTERDNRLRRAEYEVLLPIATEPRAASDLRSFDLFLAGERPRLRVNYAGVSYAFLFKPIDPAELITQLRGMGIYVNPIPAVALPCPR